MLKVTPWKGVVHFGKKGKLVLRCVEPFKILERIGPVVYQLRLPEELSGVHDTFHVSNLKKCLANASLHMPLDEIKIDKTFRFIEEPVENSDLEVMRLKCSRMVIVKVRFWLEVRSLGLKLRESSFQNIRFLRSGSQSNVGCKKSCQSSEYGSDLDLCLVVVKAFFVGIFWKAKQRAFWGADDEEVSEGGIPRVIVLGYDGLPLQPVAPPSPDYIPGPENPQTPPVPQDEDEREPMFVQAHDPDYVPEPIYPEYIPLEDDHEFSAEEQPLPPVDSPTAESPGYVTESDPEEDPDEYEDDETEDGPVDYPMDGGDDGDDDDGDSSRDDANDEDEDEDDEEDKEEEEHLAPADSTTVKPADEPVFPPEGT
ncbi:hypothetical protein Tco_0228536 [Tanacetum coccineum]